MAHDIEIIEKTPAEFAYKKRRSDRMMRSQLTMFALMIFMTLISFAAVQAGFSAYFVVPVVLLLAAVQVGLQLYYFMHMSEKGHGLVSFFMYGGMLLAFLTVLAFVTIIWW
ncbi:cytochrome c oxidase subunit IVB [Bhargavaea beijingensis]|uniref:Cytochrome c oxidase subunit IVB n=1 Tax=Bhargavaea beijingensis TaxID=426756 RepID=A0ABX9ZGJ8_9BACL|nr:cytochrome c oxidase subunit IVB [Bhargavaea beijingensis]MCW1926823.1 cytochrome c oxidase subunit IVB [Bhargavaea beijingensis]RSK36931.1 cytochrome c oxidase subunit IVB [Bhargavaea beijingensis]